MFYELQKGLASPPGGVRVQAIRTRESSACTFLRGESNSPLFTPRKTGEWMVPSPTAQSLSLEGRVSQTFPAAGAGRIGVQLL